MSQTRRTAVLGMAGLATLGAARCARNPDVVIVGAGAAGIAAAWAAQAQGLNAIVLEARARVGGRAFTDTSTWGSPFDVGCGWLHKADDNPWASYARDNDFTLRPHEHDLERVWGDAGPLPTEPISAAETAISATITAASRDVAAARLVDLSDAVEEAAGDYIGALDMGVDLDRMSTFDFANADDLAPNLLCAEGYGTIVAHRARGLRVVLNTPVRRVRWDGPGVTVETGSGVIRAEAVIVTASTGVLASGALRFTPELPTSTQSAINDLPMGILAKIPLKIRDQRFGLEPFSGLLLARRGRRDINFLCFPFATDLMVGFVGGELGWALSAAGEAAAVDFATEALVHMFGSGAAAAVQKGGMTPWASDPWALGAYATARPGRYAARAALAAPIADRIFFAGEALAGGLSQTCGGAYRSGETAARAVAAALA